MDDEPMASVLRIAAVIDRAKAVLISPDGKEMTDADPVAAMTITLLVAIGQLLVIIAAAAESP